MNADTPATATTEPTVLCSEGVQIDACAPLDRLVVRTRNSQYDVVVVSPQHGDVLVRGGQLFPEFRQAHLLGATAGGHTIKLLGVYTGLCMELYADCRSVTTSPVLQVYRAATCASATSAARS